MSEVILRGGTILTMDGDWHLTDGDVAAIDGELVAVGGSYTPRTDDYEVLDAHGCAVLPGFVQAHTHMCQTLARGRADDLELLDWLREVIWPYEAALDSDDVTASAELACVELLTGGTTAILDMGTVHHTDALFAAARDSGLRATIGKAMMDEPDERIPVGLRESTSESLAEAARLCQRWNGAERGRLRYAYAPRFALSCTEELLSAVGRAARLAGVRIHTHASENQHEIAEVRRRTGTSNIEYLHRLGLTGPEVTLAHCVWLSEHERALLADTGTHIAHCPSSNLKLASGIAAIPEARLADISVGLGADGAPCNNNLDAFMEMRIAALIQKPRAGARAMAAPLVVRMATMGGAHALGLEHLIGSLEVGKRADVIAVALDGPHVTPTSNPYSALVYACRATDVRQVVIDGRVIVRDHRLLTLEPRAVADRARHRARAIFDRIS